jgi:hypothetical protein
MEKFLKQMHQHVNRSRAMESRDHFKNGANLAEPKEQGDINGFEMNTNQLVTNSLRELIGVWNCKSDSKLIFPPYRETEERRVSEQEARFLFVKQLEKQKEFYYSVETPTSKKYRFGENPEHPRISDNGRSGSMDVSLYKTKAGKPVSHIEFKAHNVKTHGFLKDFVKLRYENDGSKLTNYFVHIIKTYDKGTINSLIEKYNSAFAYKDEDFERTHPGALKNRIVVCVCFLSHDKYEGKKQILFFDESSCKLELGNIINLTI